MPEPPTYSRRLILQSGTAASVCALAAPPGLGALAQNASEPRGATHHRFTVGTCDVLVLSDGHLVVPAGMLAVNVPSLRCGPS